MSDSNSNQAQKANLARIRDNQRRSRARRKEYLQELETKYRTCEAVGVEASAEIQSAARRVLEENKRLRQLLKQQGLSDADIDGFTPPPPEASPPSSKRELSETPLVPPPSSVLTGLLSARKKCRPGSACKSEDTSDQQISIERVSSWPSHAPTPLPIQPQPHSLNRRPTPQLSPQARPLSSMSGPSSTNEQYHGQSTPSQPNDYAVYDPQSDPGYMYSMSLGNMAQWNLPAATESQSYMNALASASEAVYPSASDSSTSCFVAADAIRSYSMNAGPEVERALGCRDGSECHVSNSVVFDLMDRYSGANSNDRLA